MRRHRRSQACKLRHTPPLCRSRRVIFVGKYTYYFQIAAIGHLGTRVERVGTFMPLWFISPPLYPPQVRCNKSSSDIQNKAERKSRLKRSLPQSMDIGVSHVTFYLSRLQLATQPPLSVLYAIFRDSPVMVINPVASVPRVTLDFSPFAIFTPVILGILEEKMNE